MKEIPLTQGKVALVDDEDYERVMQYRWRAHRDHDNWYAETGGGDDVILMHRLIFGTRDGMETDHRDGNGLNNQRYNLRQASRSQNCMNRRGWSSRGYKGVCKVSKSNKWGARIQINGKMIWIGSFVTPEEAAKAYDQYAALHHDEFAKTNLSMGLT